MSFRRGSALKRLYTDISGATAIEYALITGLIAVAIMGAVAITGENTRGQIAGVENSLNGVSNGSSGGAGGSASDIAIQAVEIVKARERIARTIARQTGKSLEVVLTDIERDRWLSAEEAVEYGLVSRIIERKVEILGA